MQKVLFYHGLFMKNSELNYTECWKCGEECENFENDHHSPYDTDSEASSDHEVDSDEE